jgi:hypothetical protein
MCTLTSHEDDYSATVEKEERLVAALPYSMNADRDAVQMRPTYPRQLFLMLEELERP